MITVVSTPTRTVNSITSNVVAARAQALFQFSTNLAAEENYKINIRILDENDVALITTTFKYSVKPDGTVNVDLGRIVTEINEAGGALSIRFKIGYSETYTGTVGAETIIGEWLAVYGEKQILSEGGANMAGYLLNNSTTKQASVFTNPVYWEGFSRRISIVMDSDFATRTGLAQYRIKNVQYDINKNVISTEYGSYITDLTPRLDLDFITGTAPYIGASIDGLTEEMIHERRTVCKNPILIDWLNSKGGVDQWIFEVDQIYEREAGVGLSYQSAISGDIDSVFRTKFRQSPKWTQQVIMKAENLTLDQLKALQEIKSSISVRAQLNLTGSEWVGVVCSGKFSTIHNSGDDRHEFTMQIEFPDNFDFNNAVDYTVQPTPPTLYEGADIAISLYRLTTDVTKNKCVKIRRDSDNTTTDILFNDAPDYDFITLSSPVSAGGTLGDWVGANNGFVEQWYNQGVAPVLELKQILQGSQPQLITTGVINLKNGTPMIESLAAHELISSVNRTGYKSDTDISAFAVSAIDTQALLVGVPLRLRARDNGANFQTLQLNRDARTDKFSAKWYDSTSGTAKADANMLLARTALPFDQVLNSTINNGGALTFSTWDNLLAGDQNVAVLVQNVVQTKVDIFVGHSSRDTNIQAIIIFDSNKIADLTTIQNDLITKFSIPAP